jgi:DNA polymerase-3 subunit chi
MAWEQGHRVSVLAPDESTAQLLDELMWDYPPARFLPHERAPGAAGSSVGAPISIVASADQVGADRDVVVNLGGEAVPDPGRLQRLLEIVPAEPRMRAASRDKFRRYRQLGLQPTHHDIQSF